jgi:RNA polymerase sigma-70 factor (ECF subfamily)
MDQLRKKYRKRQIVVINNPDILEHNSESKQATPAKDTEEKELSEQIFHALNKLSPEKRIVVTMFEMEGFSLEDIAHIIKKPLGTVKSRLFHGRKELASHLQTYMDT